MKIKNSLTGEVVSVVSTTNHPQSSYGKAVWVDGNNQAYCQKGLELIAGYELIDEKMEFGKLLRSIREAKGLNKNSFIKNGMRIETLAAIEEGGKNYTIDSLFQYLGILGVDLQSAVKSITK